jgi:hypothetical protein
MATSKTSKKQTKKSNPSKSSLPAPSNTATRPATVAATHASVPDDDLSGQEAPTAQAAFTRFLPEALGLATGDILPYRMDAALALHNVKLGVASVLPHRTELEAELPAIAFANIAALPDLALALRYAVIQAARGMPEERVMRNVMKEMQPLRRKLLSVAEGLAQTGLLPQAQVDAIRAGHGWEDGARDLLDLHDLFLEHEPAIAGKHPVTEAILADAQRIGTFLLSNLKPRQGRPAQASAGPSVAVDARDRLHTLLQQRFILLRKAGHYLFGDRFDAHVPPLQARTLGARPTKEAAPETLTSQAPLGEPSPA